MNYPHPYTLWKDQDSCSRLAIILSITLVLFAYLPTLQFDYVTTDQWRVFRYSQEPLAPFERAKVCAETAWKFYLLTGRPLVWLTECLEHTVVSSISDFLLLRPIVLVVVLLTVLCLGFVISPLVCGLPAGIIAASAFVMMPGYSFMYVQGATAMMVLLSVICAGISFVYYKRVSSTQPFVNRNATLAGFLFFLALLMYPSFAFVIVTLALATFGLDHPTDFSRRFIVLARLLAFCVAISIVYYCLIKLSISLLEWFDYDTPHLNRYEFSAQLDISLVFDRASYLIESFFIIPPLNFPLNANGFAPVLVLLFGFCSAALASARAGRLNLIGRGMVLIGVVLVACVVLIGSVSPWLVSGMDNIAPRFVLPWYLFFCISLVSALVAILSRLMKAQPRYMPLVLMLVFLAPVAIEQNRRSIQEVMSNNLPLQLISFRLESWVGQRGWVDQRFIRVAFPPGDPEKGGYYAELVEWMIVALLRDYPKLAEFRLVNCVFDTSCVERTWDDPSTVVLGFSYGETWTTDEIVPYVVDLSELHGEPLYPVMIDGIASGTAGPRITASSVMDPFGPTGLLTAAQPGWHAERDPTYPQDIEVDFRRSVRIGAVDMLPQDQHLRRMPAAVKLSTSLDGTGWREWVSFDGICDYPDDGGWKALKFPSPTEGRFLRVKILSNCGDEEFLTLRGIRVR